MNDLRIPDFLRRQRNAPDQDDDEWVAAGDEAPPQPDMGFLAPQDDAPQDAPWWIGPALVLAIIAAVVVAWMVVRG